jgi:hypothetical protein
VEAGAADPVAQGGAVEIDALTAEDRKRRADPLLHLVRLI